jgi:hypothetical protein
MSFDLRENRPPPVRDGQSPSDAMKADATGEIYQTKV